MISGLKTLYYNITRNIQSSELVDRVGNILGAVKSQALLYFLLFSGEHYFSVSLVQLTNLCSSENDKISHLK